MSDNKTRQESPRSPSGYSLRIARIAGIEIRLDLSVIVIFALIVASLGGGIFPEWHEDWSGTLIWGTALVSGVLFFASLLAHELAHSVVSQHYGYPVPRITLFLFGGMAEMGQEPDKPGVEFQVAIAGPLMSVVISLACSAAVALMVEDASVIEQVSAGDTTALATLGPVETSLLWLGSINMILAIFNMIPGFPMDGGRVFRSIMWGITGDQIKATRWASTGGRLFGWTLIAMGVLSLFGGGGLSGLWWILIGWFISNLARMSYTQLLTDRALKGFKIADLMNTAFERADGEMPLPEFIDGSLLRSTQQVWPVMTDDRLHGFVVLEDIVSIEPEERGDKRVADVMRRFSDVPTLDADASARTAFDALNGAEIEPVPVVRSGVLEGFLSRADVMRWMSLHELD